MPDYKLKRASDAVSAEVRKAVEERKQLYQERDHVMHELRRYRLMRQKSNLPRAWQRRLGRNNVPKLPIMYRLVQTAVSAVAKEYPTIYVEPRTVNDRAAADGEAKALNLLLQTIDRQLQGRYLYRLYFTLFGDGLAVTKTQEGPWSGMPLPPEEGGLSEYNEEVDRWKEEHPLPFYTTIVDPLTFYPPLDEYGEGATVEISWRSARDSLRRLGLEPQNGNLVVVPEGKPYPETEFPPAIPPLVETREIWTKDYCALLISQLGGEVWLFDNPMSPDSPYTWGFADPTGVEDPTNVGMSVAYPLYYIAPGIDTMVGIMMSWAMYAAPTPYTTAHPGPGVRSTQETQIEDFNPGMWHHFSPGRTPGFLQPPDVGKPVLDFLNFLISSADRGGLPSLVSGGELGSRMPALTFQYAYGAALDRLRPAVKSAENILGGTLILARKIIAKYGLNIRVNGWWMPAEDEKVRQWAVIRASEAKKGRQLLISLATDATQDLIAKGTHGLYMVDGGLWGMRRGMKFSGVKNVEDEFDEIAADAARKAAIPIQAEMIIREDEELGGFLAEQQAQQSAAAAPPGAAPPAPTGPGRNRAGVPAGAGGGRRGGNPTQRRRGAGRGYPGGTYGRT